MQPEYNIARFNSRRSPVFSRRGMIATAHPLASAAGLELLQAGGNAVDAAIGAAAVLGVIEPYQTGLGGDAFALVYRASDRSVAALNASGPAPARATTALMRERGYAQMPRRSPLAWTVPGCVDGWWQMSRRYGRLPWARLFRSAIDYAHNGFPMAPGDAASWALNESVLRADPVTAGYMLIDGKVPLAGDVLVQRDLAATFERVAAHGRDEFYTGETAARVVAASAALGGLLDRADLAAYRAQWQVPIEVNYLGIRVLECPPNGQGLAALVALKALQLLPLLPERDSPECWHRLIEVMKVGMQVAAEHVADPDQVDVPVEALLAMPAIAERLAAAGSGYATMPTICAATASDTVYLAVADEEGNAVSFINSVYDDFGSGHAVPGCGFLMQSRGAGFSLDSTHPNCLAPGKRPFHTIIPAMALAGDRLACTFGMSGGYMQPQGHLQLMVNLFGYGMDVQSAIDYPRFWWDAERRVVIEDGLPESLYSDLAQRGHAVTRRTHRGFGGGQMIFHDHARGVLIGGSEPRQDGCAIGY